jgi:actin-related protein 5
MLLFALTMVSIVTSLWDLYFSSWTLQARLLADAVGTHSIRAGFSNATAPHIARQSQITKYRDRKSNKQVTLFGEDVDLDAQARANVKSMWDGEALINGEVLVSLRLS